MKRTNRWLSLFLLLMILLGVFVTVPITVSAESYEYAMFPMEYINITQGVYGSYSHAGRKAIDTAGKDSGIDPVYAPFTGVIKKIYEGYVVWLESSNPVVWADGTIDYMTIMIMHDNDTSDLYVGQVIKQGTRFFEEGTAGKATGNHIHLECGKGKMQGTGWYKNSYGKWTIYNSVMPYDALFLSSSTIVKNDYNYNWRYVNGETPTPTYGSTNPDDYTYPDPDTTDTIYRTSPTMKGSTVAWVQAVLYQLGYSIEVDGSYGQNSEAVIKQFQSDNGLEVDGRVGPATKRKLLELWNEKKHTHSYSVYTESSHPHKEYNKCSCGDVQYTGQVFASWENTGYEAAHPHKGYRTCWCGYKEYTGETQTVHTCDSCLPEKSVLSVLPGTSLDYTSFSWNPASGADYYELIVYNKNDMATPVEWLYYVTTNHYKMPLPQGDYVAYVASINSALVNSSCWWVYSDKVNFSVSSAGTFAPVASAEYNGNRYEMFDINLPWEVAKAACEELGGHLVTVSSDSELAVIKELSGQGNYTLYWLGVTDKDEEGTWKNVTGDMVSYSNWHTGYPDNDNGEEHYGVLLSDGTWGDVSNMYPGKVGFICEYEGDADEDVTEPSTGDEDKPTESTEPSTDDEYKPTQPANPSTGDEDKPTNPVVTGLLGDANEDGKVNIKDATLIQKSIANLTTLTKTGEALADADLNTKINIKDATAIQKHIAGIETGFPIGEPLVSKVNN